MATIKKGTYRFNDVLTNSEPFSQDIPFISNNTTYYFYYYSTNQYGHILYTDDIATYDVAYKFGIGWSDEAYQTITIPADSEVSDEFYEWFTANVGSVSATIRYNGSTIVNLFGGQTATLKCEGMKMDSDVVVEVADGGGGACTNPHAIEVDELPTENIDENAVYYCGGMYYKYTNVLEDVIYVFDGAWSFRDECEEYDITCSFNTIPTKTDVGVLKSDFDNTRHFYYVEDEADVLGYADFLGWVSLSFVLNGMTYGGAISDISEAVTEGCYYSMFRKGWQNYILSNGEFTIAENGTYDTRGFESVTVSVPDTAIVGKWKFNRELATPDHIYQEVNFTSTMHGEVTNFTGMDARDNTMSYKLSNGAFGAYYNGSWADGADVVDFGDEPQFVLKAYKEWVEQNAERQPATLNLQEKTATDNGDVLPDEGYDGLSKVTVNVTSSGGGGGTEINTGTCSVKVAVPASANYYFAYEKVSGGNVVYQIDRNYLSSTSTKTVRCDSIMFIQASNIKGAEISGGELVRLVSGYGIVYKTPSEAGATVEITLTQ